MRLPSASAAGPPPPGNALRRWAATNGGGPGDIPTQALAVRDAQNYDWIVALQRDFPPYVDAMKQANPTLRIMAYLNGTFAQADQGPTTGTYPDAYFARDASGRYITARASGNWLMDVSSSAWVENRSQTCADYATTARYDGCYLDVLGTSGVDPSYVTSVPVHPGTTTTWTSSEWLGATANLAAAVKSANPGRTITGNGLANGQQYSDPAQGPTSNLIGPLDGANAQGFVRNENAAITTYRSVADWKADVDMLVDAGTRGKTVMAMTKIGVAATAAQVGSWERYAMATFLLGTNGNQYFMFDPDGKIGTDAYDSQDLHVYVGLPTAGYRADASGAYTRTFTRGIAVVNPTSSPEVVALGGLWRDLDGALTTSASMPAHTGMLFTPPTSPSDFDRSGSTDLGIYRGGTWFVRGQGQTQWGGDSSDIPVPADYDGDGKTDFAVYRASTGTWFVRGQGQTQWGGDPSDVPVPADYDGDGKADFAVYRASTGTWYVLGHGEMQWGGGPSDIPVPADYDGDGKADFGVFRRSTGVWYVAGVGETRWGGDTSDVPVPGTYVSGNSVQSAVYRASTGTWYINGQSQVSWGGDPSDVPVPGDYNGDGATDLAVYRKRTGAWYVRGMTATAWGGDPSDIATPLPAAIRLTATGA